MASDEEERSSLRRAPPAAGAGGAQKGRPREEQGKPSGAPSLAQLLAGLKSDVGRQFSGHVKLLALELKRARQALLYLIALVVTIGVLAATAWVALWIVVVTLAMEAGLSWLSATVLLLLINALGAWIAYRRALAMTAHLTLPATMRQLSATSETSATDAHHPETPPA